MRYHFNFGSWQNLFSEPFHPSDSDVRECEYVANGPPLPMCIGCRSLILETRLHNPNCVMGCDKKLAARHNRKQ